MNVLSVNQYYHIIGGKERYVFEMEALLTEGGHTVLPFAFEYPDNVSTVYAQFFPHAPDTSTDNPLRMLRTFANRLYNPSVRTCLRRLLAKNHVDVAHIHSHVHFSETLITELHAHGIPIVYTLHDYYHLCPVGTLFTHDHPCQRCKGHRFANTIINNCSYSGHILNSFANAADSTFSWIRGSLDNVDLFISPSRFARDLYVSFGGDAAKVVTIGYYAPIHRWDYIPYPHSGPIVFAGRLYRQKGTHNLLSALAKLRLPASQEVVIAGDGPELGNLRRQAAALGMSQVEFTGSLDTQSLYHLYQKSICAVVPSIWYEVLGFAALEPMTVGRPVVAANIGGLPELVSHGVTGLLHEPTNPDDLAYMLEVILSSPARASEMGREARKRVERDFSPESHYRAVMAAYYLAMKYQ